VTQPGDVVVLASLRLSRFNQAETVTISDDAIRGLVAREQTADRTDEVRAAIAALAPIVQRGVHVVFEAPPPLFKAPPFRCVDWFNRNNPLCEGGMHTSRALLDRYRAPLLQSLGAIASALPNVSVWDPFPVLCPGRVCDTMRGNKPLFFDGDHVSGYANRLLVPSLAAHVSALAS